ncbi:MAG: HDIG domain-containing protein [Desulfobulbaceae bacterium]|nr:HDIG domain-containing protein [Desulfobulbaceae bacterium]
MKNLDRDWLALYPAALRQGLAAVVGRLGFPLYPAGGAVRDWLAGNPCRDLDVTVPGGAVACARDLARTLGGAFVPLDEEEGVARVVWQGHEVDFSDFREGTTSIEADLARRDFTVNAMAVAFDPEKGGLAAPYTIIDPTGGCEDFRRRLVRATSPGVFRADPLRLLRAYRFVATLGFRLDGDTERLLATEIPLLARVAPERILHELSAIMASARAALAVSMMEESSLLWSIFPELRQGEGMAQPDSHHLDVFAHNRETLRCLEGLLADPAGRFPGHGPEMADYLGSGRRAERLKWAALFHDLGKPACQRLRNGRITFYNHDREGARQFADVGRRLRLSREAIREVCLFIELHMWPFHLNNVRRKSGITPRACLRLVKAVGEELPGLFLLAMADSLAGQGPDKPPGMEAELALLYDQVDRTYRESIKPVLEMERLLTGHDLIARFGLAPGVLVGKILKGLEGAQVAGDVSTVEEARAWVADFLAKRLRGKSD